MYRLKNKEIGDECWSIKEEKKKDKIEIDREGKGECD